MSKSRTPETGPELVAGESSEGSPRLKIVPRLHDIDGVRRLMARVIREMYHEDRDSLEGYRMVQALHLLARVIEGSSIEDRVAELEGLLAKEAA